MSRGRSDLLEEVLVDLDEVNRTLHLHSDPVLDHELGEQGAIDKHNARGYGICVGDRVRGVRRRGEEDALVRLRTVERSDEGLHFGPTHGVTCRVALRLNVDAGKAECVLVDHAVDATVVRQLCARRFAEGTAVPHCDEKVEDGLFKERGVTLLEALKQLLSDHLFVA